MKPEFKGRRMATVAAAGVVLAAGVGVAVSASAATSGPSADHLFVSEVKDSSATSAVTIARFTGAGSADGASIALPTSASGANKAFSLDGDSSAVGALARSTDGRYVTLAGYSSAPGASSDSAARVVARVDGSGTADTSTTLGSSFLGEKVRSAITDTGSEFWVTGNGGNASPYGGLVSAQLGASSSTVLAGGTDAQDDARTVQLSDGNVWFGSEKSPAGLYELNGSTAGLTIPFGSDGEGPISFVLLDRSSSVAGADTLYVLQETVGIYKYSFDGTSWTSRGKISSTSGYTGITGMVDGSGYARLYGVNGDSSKNTLMQLTDSAASTSSPSISSRTTIATAPSGIAFRGVALAPTSGTPTSAPTTTPTTPPTTVPTTPPTTAPTSSPTASPTAGQSTSTPTIALADAYLSGAVGGIGDETATVTVAQSGGDANLLAVAASASSKTSVAQTSDVTVTGTGATRQIAIAPRGQGYADLTLKVTAPNGKSATTTLHFAASAAVQDPADTRYISGASDSSAAIDAGSGYFIAGDDENNVLRLYNGSGAPMKTWDFTSQLGVSSEIDIEASARVGNTIYWTGSMGNNKDGKLEPDRSTLFTTTISGTGASTQLTFAGVYKGLRADLIAWDKANGNKYGFSAGSASGQIPKEINGFNVEGIEFAPGSTTTAYIGFRAPLVPPSTGGKALLVPVTDMDKLTGGTHATFGTPITMDLGGLSIRDIRETSAGRYLIVAGSWAADDNSAPYALYQWDGVAADAPTLMQSLPTTDPGAWEAVVTESGNRVLLLTDSGDTDWYGDGTAAKDLTHPEWQKSRAVWFTES